ncbi:MAG: CvpA family protein [Proteobacteria bacterium]|nr:CvpA family protein [Pseudomonadota bacterium]MDE3207481.1 CvpA family protein [Pseudomonadota bacterium]
MTVFDYGVIAVIVVSAIIGLIRGLTRELLSLLGWFVAIWLVMHETLMVAGLMPKSITNAAGRDGLAFLLLFMLGFLVTWLVRIFLTRFIEGAGLGGLDRILGLVFGSVRGLALCIVLVLVAGFTSLPEQPLWSQATLSRPLERMAESILPWLPSDVVKRVHY